MCLSAYSGTSLPLGAVFPALFDFPLNFLAELSQCDV